MAETEEQWISFFHCLSVLVRDIENRSTVEEFELTYLQERCKDAIEGLQVINFQLPEKQCITELLREFLMFYNILDRELKNGNKCDRVAILQTMSCQTASTGKCGRPKFIISEDTLLNLRGLGYTWKDISSMLLVSRWTLHRRVKELGIAQETGYSVVPDSELDQIVTEYKNQVGSFAGRSMVLGFLKSQGIRVQQRRVAKCLIRIDPEGSRIRWACVVRRRKYSVPGPNSLWHIDGHHSLIHWGFVLHGAIDGFSRLITFLQCSTNNKKETVANLFTTAIEQYGTPSRIRTDHGGENSVLWSMMDGLRGEGRGSYLAGSSVRNQRIERLWRDVWTYVCYRFYYTFQAMEEESKSILCDLFHCPANKWRLFEMDVIVSRDEYRNYNAFMRMRVSNNIKACKTITCPNIGETC